MMRHLEAAADQSVVSLLSALADRSTIADQYREAMQLLGHRLGEEVAQKVHNSRPRIMVVCTVEDADFLARGVIEGLRSCGADIRLTCFWNTKLVPFGDKRFEITPIVRRYEEPLLRKVDALVIVKSIISGACVVKTNLMEMIGRTKPTNIFIVAPVMHVDSETKLRAEFPADVNQKFRFIVFARDEERTSDGEIRPGIGGEVYSRLGFMGREDKNTYVPEIIKERRPIARSLAKAMSVAP